MPNWTNSLLSRPGMAWKVFNSGNENKAICKANTRLGNEFLDRLKVFRHYSLHSLVCLSMNNYTHRETLILIGPCEFIISPFIK